MTTKRQLDLLRQLRADPTAFRSALLVDTDKGPKRFGTVAEPWQRADFSALDPSWQRVVDPGRLPFDGLPPYRAWLERPRGHSKTSDLAVMLSWALFSAGRKLSGIACAADRDQGRLLRDAIETLVRLNPWLGEFLEVTTDRVTNRETKSSLTIITSDVGSSYGVLADFVVCDEISHWAEDKGARLWESLLSTAAKRAHCLLVCISNAGYVDGWQWRTREAVRADESWYFNALSGPMASWITADRLAEQERLLPRMAYERLWLNRWCDSSGDALEAGTIDGAIVLAGPGQRQDGWAYAAGVDLGISRDASAVVVIGRHDGYMESETTEPSAQAEILDVMADLGLLDRREAKSVTKWHEGSGRYALADVRVWKPTAGRKVSLEDVEQALLELHRRFGLAMVCFDQYQAAYLSERLAKMGINSLPLAQTGALLQQIGTEVLDAFRDKAIDLFPHDDLIPDLKGLRVEARSYGFRLTSPHKRASEAGTRHGDSATAFGLALYGARRLPVTMSYRGSLVLSC